jgi:hypothetical protein
MIPLTPDEIANDPYYFQTSIMNHYFSWPTGRESPMNDEKHLKPSTTTLRGAPTQAMAHVI